MLNTLIISVASFRHLMLQSNGRENTEFATQKRDVTVK